MEPSILPIVAPNVDWAAFLPNAQRALGRSVSAGLDDNGQPCVGAAPFACAIGEFSKSNSHPVQVLRRDKLVLRHLHYAFLVALTRQHFLLLSSFGLAVSPAEHGDFAVVGGTVEQWREATLGLLCPGCASGELKKFAVMIVAYFESIDFGLAWSAWRKEYTSDSLYNLVGK